MKILVYALQRSGTNYLEKLIRKKYRVSIINGQDRARPEHKHFRLYDEKHIIPEPQYANDITIGSLSDFESSLKRVPHYYIVASKDPYSWLLSYRQWAENCSWQPVEHDYVEEYNLFYGKWLELAQQSDRIVLIRYIDLLRDPDQVLDRLESTMGLRKKLLGKLRSCSIRKVSQSNAFSEERRQYYLQNKYLDQFEEDDLRAVNAKLDAGVLDKLGYTLFTP